MGDKLCKEGYCVSLKKPRKALTLQLINLQPFVLLSLNVYTK